MQKNIVGLATLVVALASVATLTTGYAGQGAKGGAPEIPDHPLIKGPIAASDVESFRDASTLWLTDALMAEGAQAARGKKTKFNETTIIHTSVFLTAFSESLVRHKEWVPAGARPVPVGGDPKDVRPLTGQEYSALVFIFNKQLKSDLKNVSVDQNGLRGKVSVQDLSMTREQLRQGTQETASGISSFTRGRGR